MGITEEHIERIKKHAETMEGFARAAVNVSSELDAVLRDNQQMERQIERLNEANDSLRERLDRGESHDAYMKLPLDADGIAIRPGDKIYFNGDPESEAIKCIAVGCSPYPVEFTDWEETGTTAWEEGLAFTHRQLTSKSVDSWERLEEDARQRVCSYFGIDQDTASCDDCPHGSSRTGRTCWQNASLDMIARAKKLAGIEEEAQR